MGADTEYLHVKRSDTGQEFQVPISHNAVSAKDFQKGDLKLFDPGLQNTAVVATNSIKTGGPGRLLYRGYPMEELFKRAEFEHMLHLMCYGTLPTGEQAKSLQQAIAAEMIAVPQYVYDVVQRFPQDSTPVAMVQAALSAYLANDKSLVPAHNGGNIYHNNAELVDKAIIKTVAAYAVATGLAATRKDGVAPIRPRQGMTYYENLFTMMGNVDPKTGRPDPIKLSCFRRFGIVNADHGMALCAFSFLATASSCADPISSLMASLASAYGPLHFGATETGLRKLAQIGKPENVPQHLEKVKRGEARLSGFGHRTYKHGDPRVTHIKGLVDELQMDDHPLLKIADEIQSLASKDEYFLKRGLKINADFYGIFVFTGCGFPPDFIPIAMIAQRLVGLMCHWREQTARSLSIFRPSHIYTGSNEERKWPSEQLHVEQQSRL